MAKLEQSDSKGLEEVLVRFECYRELSIADEAEAEAVHRPGGQ